MEQEVYEKVAYQILLSILVDNGCINRYEQVPENLKPVLDEFVDYVAEGDEAVRIGWFKGYEKLSNELNKFFPYK